MLGMDVMVGAALLLALASTLLCITYGSSRWNADADVDLTAEEGSKDPPRKGHGP